jgi:hypothetical protein
MMRGSDGSYFYRLGWFIAARLIHHLHPQDFILGNPDRLNGANLGRMAGDAEKQLRGQIETLARRAYS